MVVLHPRGEPAPFFAHVAAAPLSVLLLDYDGTLAPFHMRPNEALPYAGVQERVMDIVRSGRTRVVFVTGRAIADFLPLLSIEPMPEVWGSHGWERRFPDGRYECPPLSATLMNLLSAAAEIEDSLPEGTRAERKPYSIAVHWRGAAPDIAQRIERQIRQYWDPLVTQCAEAAIAAFDGGLELRIKGHTKADAVRTLLRETGGGAPVAFLGDDFTDEDAFCALSADGLGVLVRDAVRPTAASLWLQPPAELLWFLEQWRASVTSPRDRGARSAARNTRHGRS